MFDSSSSDEEGTRSDLLTEITPINSVGYLQLVSLKMADDFIDLLH